MPVVVEVVVVVAAAAGGVEVGLGVVGVMVVVVVVGTNGGCDGTGDGGLACVSRVGVLHLLGVPSSQ